MEQRPQDAARSKKSLSRLALVGLVSFLVGVAGVLALSQSGGSDRAGEPIVSGPRPVPAATPPAVEALHAPQDVVRRQMDALTRYRLDRSAIAEVYAYASPANRSVTGPLGRFEKMILAPPYDTMAVNRGYRIGEAVEHGDLATVLVTVVATNNEVHLFRFYLSRDAAAPDGGWQTDRVFCLTGGPPVDAATPLEI
ncbi:hypothetical protein Pla123a_09750 [Posidoniimonas polymericola]|uniref:DUF4864 domain-containing protein n=1 Tax=Posidoniimonas polymericola TaxID=2528002 RepID=A0A5C5YT94_9BACT|nr:hypothetical protein [Posidoniimonas polymericola]TWT78185.1 hypothetical protein Pla123a_09750 [Posidoniimonas polymericola]